MNVYTHNADATVRRIEVKAQELKQKNCEDCRIKYTVPNGLDEVLCRGLRLQFTYELNQRQSGEYIGGKILQTILLALLKTYLFQSNPINLQLATYKSDFRVNLLFAVKFESINP